MEATINMDESGRMVLPKAMRGAFQSRVFVAKLENRAITLKPIQTWDEAFGSLKRVDMKKFARQHEENSRV